VGTGAGVSTSAPIIVSTGSSTNNSTTNLVGNNAINTGGNWANSTANNWTNSTANNCTNSTANNWTNPTGSSQSSSPATPARIPNSGASADPGPNLDCSKISGPVKIKPVNSNVYVRPLPSEDELYRYDDRRELSNLRCPRSVPDTWYTMWSYNLTYGRACENDLFNGYRQLNQINGYVSSSALFYRTDLCAHQVNRVDNFCVDVYGEGRVEVDYDDLKSNTDSCSVAQSVCNRAYDSLPSIAVDRSKVYNSVVAVTGQPTYTNKDSVAAFMQNPPVAIDTSGAARVVADGLMMAAVVAIVMVQLAL